MFFLIVSSYLYSENSNVLSCLAANKAIYDAYGEYALKEGIVTADGTKIGGSYFMRMNADSFYEKHFSHADILADSRAINGSDLRPSFFADSLGGQGVAAKGPPEDIEVTLDCTLAEMYNGAIKQVEYERSIVKHDAKTLVKERIVQQVEVKPGFSEESCITFKGQGHQQAGQAPANLLVKFKQIEHPDYRRLGDDLVLTTKITLTQAIEMKPVTFTTLDGRKLTISADEQISPQTCKLVHSEGMPMTQDAEFKEDLANVLLTGQQLPKGSLYLRFDIQFPTQLKLDVKKTLIECLKNNEECQ